MAKSFIMYFSLDRKVPKDQGCTRLARKTTFRQLKFFNSFAALRQTEKIFNAAFSCFSALRLRPFPEMSDSGMHTAATGRLLIFGGVQRSRESGTAVLYR